MQKKTKAPHTFKDNFWSRQRVEKRMTLKEVAEVLGLKESRVSMYFSGQNMPNEQFIRDVCDLFDVDYHTGNLEFQHAHREWKAHQKATVISAPPAEPEKCENKVEEVKPNFDKESVLELIYGKVDRCVYKLIEDLLDNI